MNQLRAGIRYGIIAGLFTFLFGGWSVAMIGMMMGIGLGLSLGSELERKGIQVIRQSLPTIGTYGIVLLIVSLLQNFIIQPLVGNSPSDLSVVIPANLVGVVGGVIFAGITTSLHGLSEQQERTGKLILLASVVVFFPFVDNLTELRWTASIIYSLIFVILGMGLNIVVGYAGLLDLGYAAFFAIGAYTAGIFSSPQVHIFLNFWLVIWIAAAIAAISGFILGAPTLPLRGDYLAIVTLGFGEIIPIAFKNLTSITIHEPLTCWIIPGLQRLFGETSTVGCFVITDKWNLTNGELGITPIGRPSLPFIGAFTSDNPVPWYFLIIAIILFTIFLVNRLRESRLGRAWMAIREDELAAAQMGIDPVRTKLLAFAMGATFSGFAGAFYGSYIAGIFPTAFEFSASIIILCTVILGGIGNVYGVIVGGLVLQTADHLFLPHLHDFFAGLLNHTVLPALASNKTLHDIVAQNGDPTLYRFMFFGLTLVIMMAVRPEGLLPSAQRRMELHAADEAPNIAATASMKK